MCRSLPLVESHPHGFDIRSPGWLQIQGEQFHLNIRCTQLEELAERKQLICTTAGHPSGREQGQRDEARAQPSALQQASTANMQAAVEMARREGTVLTAWPPANACDT